MSLKFRLAQLNFTVGDFRQNLQKMSQLLSESSDEEIIVFPECSITGYPQQDLLNFSSFAKAAQEASRELISSFSTKTFVFGSVEKNEERGRPLRNTALFVERGKLTGRYFKRLLPTYDVFDEDRYFEPGREALILDLKGQKVSVTICEDIWTAASNEFLQNRYLQSPLEDSRDADIILNLSASPFEYAKIPERKKMLSTIAKNYQKTLIYVNSIGANDSLIFDGRSCVWNSSGELCQELSAFEEDSSVLDTSNLKRDSEASYEVTSTIYDALLLGIKDYCHKSRFSSVCVGLSGGIDSALVACLAIDALGVENVTLVMMPSRFTTKESNEDALQLAVKTQAPLHILSIEEIFNSSLKTLEFSFKGLSPDLTEENLQSRIRGNLLMAFSNKFGSLVLTTGNKSELAVGYCTLYGDMNGALAPLSDVYKTQVFELAKEANRRWNRIPERIFSKPPSAELRANQKDQDELPEYEVLDQILKLLIEEAFSIEEVLEKGFSKEDVEKVFDLYQRSEFKRYQMPVGLKISSKAFGIGRRMPVVEKFFKNQVEQLSSANPHS
jgi:NAD+ synthase (glutamine-hydrolysing)